MADNVRLNPGAGGDEIATEDIGGVELERMKIALGNFGVDDGDVSATNPIPVTGSVALTGGVTGTADQYDGFVPHPRPMPTGTTGNLATDGAGNLKTRATVLTDEQSFRDDFSGSSLATSLTGTLSFQAGLTVVVGTGTSFLTQVDEGDYIKLDAHAETAWTRVETVNSDTSITLSSGYGGALASGLASSSNWRTGTGAGGTIAVGSSSLTIATGITSGALFQINRQGDYGPFTYRQLLSLSQRVLFQEFRCGFQDVPTVAPSVSAVFRFAGTSNTAVECISQSSSVAADTQTTTVTIPKSDSASLHEYKIDVSPNQVTFAIDGVTVATHTIHIPGPYTVLSQVLLAFNSSVPVGTTNLVVDYVYFQNVDRVQVDDDFQGEPFRVALQSHEKPKTTYSASVTGLAAAAAATDIFTLTGSATKIVKVRRIRVTATQTAAGTNLLILAKHSAADTGGTSAAVTAVPHDSSSPAASATVLSYTANPTVGASVGNLRASRMFIPAAATTSAPTELIWDFNIGDTEAPILRGVAEQLALNLNGATLAGGTFSISTEWTEE